MIYTYFKTSLPTTEPEEEHKQSLENFKNKLSELGHFYTLYDNIDQLINKFTTQLDLLDQKGYIELQKEFKQKSSLAIENYFRKETIVGDIDSSGTIIFGDVIVEKTQSVESPFDHRDIGQKKENKIDAFLSLFFNYGYIALFLLSVYIFIHFSVIMLIDESFVTDFVDDLKYIPFVISFTGISSASFLRYMNKSQTLKGQKK